mmetsp:Transcript_100188/g.182777  ORF Transcript_100188/g.182777 Transcript_100188/m.182777 type:complete len:80 (-) Transcript_100188:2623-2862(-)
MAAPMGPVGMRDKPDARGSPTSVRGEKREFVDALAAAAAAALSAEYMRAVCEPLPAAASAAAALSPEYMRAVWAPLPGR